MNAVLQATDWLTDIHSYKELQWHLLIVWLCNKSQNLIGTS